MGNVSGKICREKNTFCIQKPSENSAVYEIMWKNMVDTDRPQNTM
jgi:hypothetical protein